MSQMYAVVTTGVGGYDKLNYRQVERPTPGPGQVLIKVLAAGINNTEINTRLGWYSSSIDSATNALSDEQQPQTPSDGGWNKATPFPFIQGTDCCGEVIAGEGAEGLIGKRVLVRACMRTQGFDSLECQWLGSDSNGAFAEYLVAPISEVFPVACDWSDAQLATIPCAYATAENMLHRAALSSDETVLVCGASGGVGSAAVQLAKRRGAKVLAVAGRDKHQAVLDIGADQVFDRSDDLLAALGEMSIDLVVDNVAGDGFGEKLKLLKRGARLVSSGAIAGPVVALDMRDMYLKDIRLIGTTAWDEPVFANLISYIERGEIRPLLAKSFPLAQIAKAQAEFLEKRHVGNFVLIPKH